MNLEDKMKKTCLLQELCYQMYITKPSCFCYKSIKSPESFHQPGPVPASSGKNPVTGRRSPPPKSRRRYGDGG